jgi:WD40 repeat protein
MLQLFWRFTTFNINVFIEEFHMFRILHYFHPFKAGLLYPPTLKHGGVFIGCIISIFLIAGCNPPFKSYDSATPIVISQGLPYTKTQNPTPTIIPTKTHATITPSSTHTPTPTRTPSPTATIHYPAFEATEIPYPNQVISTENINQMVMLASWYQGVINAAVLAPDDSTIAVSTTNGVSILDAKSQELIYRLTTNLPITNLTYSPDGSVLAILDNKGGVSLLNKVGKEYIFRSLKEEYGNMVNHLAFSPDGLTLIIGNEWGTSLWEISNGRLLFTFEHVMGSLVHISRDGSEAIITVDNKVKFLNILSGDIVREYQFYEVSDTRLSHDRKTLAVISGDVIRIINVDDGSLLGVFGGRYVNFSPDNQMIATDHGNGEVRLWKINQDESRYEPSYNLKGFGLAKQNSLVFSRDGSIIALSQKSQQPIYGNQHNDKYKGRETLLLYKTDDGSLANSINVVYPEDDHSLAAFDKEYPYGYGPTIYNVMFSRDGLSLHTLATYHDSVGYFYRKWQIDGSLVNTFFDYPNHISGLAFSPDSRKLAYSRYAYKKLNEIVIRNILDGSSYQTIPTENRVNILAFSDDLRYLFGTDSYYGGGTFWDLNTANEVFIEPFSPDTTNVIHHYSPHGMTTWSPDRTIRVRAYDEGYPGINFYDADDNLIRRFWFPYYHIHSVSFSPDGTMVAFGFRGSIQIWGIAPRD